MAERLRDLGSRVPRPTGAGVAGVAVLAGIGALSYATYRTFT
jgi:hypothetical protein